FEAKVHAFGSNVEENVARRGDGMASSGANLLKGMKFGGTRRSEEFIPGIRSESGDACKTCLYVAKVHRTNQPGEIRTKGPQTRVSVPVLADAHHQKDRRPRKRTDHSLRENDLFELARGVHVSISICVGFHLSIAFLPGLRFRQPGVTQHCLARLDCGRSTEFSDSMRAVLKLGVPGAGAEFASNARSFCALFSKPDA